MDLVVSARDFDDFDRLAMTKAPTPVFSLESHLYIDRSPYSGINARGIPAIKATLSTVKMKCTAVRQLNTGSGRHQLEYSHTRRFLQMDGKAIDKQRKQGY